MTGKIFLSASIPQIGRGNYYEDADPFLIQFAIRELLVAALGRCVIVWGGHPAITPMVWSVCEDLGVKFSRSVILYQSSFFKEIFPEENSKFRNVRTIPAVDDDPQKSLHSMRRHMLDDHFSAGVFVGGMEGVEDEYEMFRELHPHAAIVAVGSPGGAARRIATRLEEDVNRIDFYRYFVDRLGIDTSQPRLAGDSG